MVSSFFLPLSISRDHKLGVSISYAHVEYSASAQNIIVSFEPRVFQGIEFILNEVMIKEDDS